MKLLIPFISIIFILSACTKDNSNQQTPINVSCQQYVDELGNALISVGNCPIGNDVTQQQAFALFTSLDTVNLSGTTKPGSATIFTYPNPSRTSSPFNVGLLFNNGYTGKVVVKYVITDSLLNPVAKLISNATGYASTSAIYPLLPVGRYRLFVSLSAESNNNFSITWINITKANP